MNLECSAATEKLIVAYSVVAIRKLRKKILQFSFQSLNLILEVSVWIVMQQTQNQESGELDKSHFNPRSCIKKMKGKEVFILKLPSYDLDTLAKSINPSKKVKIIGIRTGEKLHEELITGADFANTEEYKDSYIIYSMGLNNKNKFKIKDYIKNSYNSSDNKNFLSVKDLSNLINAQLKSFNK
jgi:hypothetical protein